MRLVADSGLWSTGPLAEPTPLLAVLEVSGAVLTWTVDDPSGAAQITFTDLPRADWLWRILGESGHTAVAAALGGRSPDEPQTVELAGVDVREGSLDPLRRLALGHWLRRWWPASHRDGIAALDAALLDAELALITAAAQDFFNDDTFDSDVAGLIRPHTVALGSLAREGDPRVAELVRVCSELADDVGVEFDADFEAVSPGAGRRDDYALAAGLDLGQRGTAIARGDDFDQLDGRPTGHLRCRRKHRRVADRGGRTGSEVRCTGGVVGNRLAGRDRGAPAVRRQCRNGCT